MRDTEIRNNKMKRDAEPASKSGVQREVHRIGPAGTELKRATAAAGAGPRPRSPGGRGARAVTFWQVGP
jgi:hypothetical protein